MYIPGVQRLQVDTEDPKQGPKHGSTETKTSKNNRSLARCNFECEAEMTYEAVTKCHFLQQIFKNSKIPRDAQMMYIFLSGKTQSQKNMKL